MELGGPFIHQTYEEETSNGNIKGVDYIITPEGRYVGEARVRRENNGSLDNTLFLKVGQEDVDGLEECFEIIGTGEDYIPSERDKIIGKVDHTMVNSFRKNKWCEIEEDGWNAHVDNLSSVHPSRLELSGNGKIRELAETGAEYARELCPEDLQDVKLRNSDSPEKGYSRDYSWKKVLNTSLLRAYGVTEIKQDL